MKALLFDLDGTLTKGGGAGSRAMGRALQARPQAVEELRRMRLDGMTDRSIARILLAVGEDAALPLEARLPVVREEEIDAVLAQYLQALERECAVNPYVPLPGVLALLPRLAQRDDVLLCLCTGNLLRGAQVKLASAGIVTPFRCAGTGSDAEPRPQIVRVAWQRAQALGATRGLVIGDTPRDILAAHEAGLPACGVATGRYSAHDLAAHGAELVLSSFSDVEESERLLAQ